jgi:Cu2+-exporting ATPase
MIAATSSKVCIHCGTSFRPSAARADFCCAGCEFVHGLIKQNGLSQFYELQNGGVFPVKSVVFQPRDYQWLEVMIAEKRAELDLDLQGISCIGCVWLIEKLFEKKPGALAIHVDPTLGRMNLRFRPEEFDVLAFAREIQSFGYLVGPSGGVKRSNRALIIRLGLCAALAMNAMLFTLPTYLGMQTDFAFANLFHRVTFLCSTLSFLIGGSYFFGRTWHSLRAGVLHIDLPISLGLAAAYIGSIVAWMNGALDFLYFDFISVFTFLMLVGRWTQEAAVAANRNRLLDSVIRISHPQMGEKFTVQPGGIIPVKAKLLSPGATLGMEWISGESESRSARAGQLVPSGAIALTREPVELEAIESWHDSVLARMLDTTPQTDRRARGLERFIRIYLVVVMIVGFCAFSYWLGTGAGVIRSLQVLTSILVVSCPCAAGVALPLAEEVATARARRAGVLVREPGVWERLPNVDTVVFDKTGTLTLETLALKNPEVLTALSAEHRAVLMAMVNDNMHPVASCLREHLMATNAGDTAETTEHIGLGVEHVRDGHTYRLGRSGWAADGQGDCVFACDGACLAAFFLGDELREDAGEEFSTLRRSGYDLHILSGDNSRKVATMAARLEVPGDHAHGALSPDEKAARLREIGPHRTLMIGDGANDSLAFNTSLCTGTPAIDRGLLEQKADFYFLGRSLRGIRALLDIAVAKRTTVRAVLTFAIAYNICAVALSIGGQMSPLLAAILMPLSSLVTIAIVLAKLPRS